MAPIVSTTCDTTEPPCTATDEADSASWLAWRALSAFCRTVEVSCSIEAAVCCSALACCSVRADKSLLPEAIWLDAVAIESVPWRTLPTMLARLVCMICSACSSSAASSRPLVSIGWVKSPSAMARAVRTAWPSGVVMERLSAMAAATPSSSASTVPAIKIKRPLSAFVCTSTSAPS